MEIFLIVISIILLPVTSLMWIIGVKKYWKQKLKIIGTQFTFFITYLLFAGLISINNKTLENLLWMMPCHLIVFEIYMATEFIMQKTKKITHE